MDPLVGTSLIPAEPNCVQRFFLSKAADVVVVATCITFLILSILATLPQLSSFLGPGSDVIWCALFVTSGIVTIYAAGKIAWRCREHLIEEQTLGVIPEEQTPVVVPVEQTSVVIPEEQNPVVVPVEQTLGVIPEEQTAEVIPKGHRPLMRHDTEDIYSLTLRWSELAKAGNKEALEKEGAFREETSRVLCVAANKGYIELVKMLVENSVNPSITTGYGMYGLTALHEAFNCSDLQKRKPIIQILLDHKSSASLVNKCTEEGFLTPLHLAVDPLYSNEAPKSGKRIATSVLECNIVAFLLEKGADVNLKDSKGNTPLHVAVAEKANKKSPNIEVIKLLVQKGSSWDVKNADNKTPLQILQKSHPVWYQQFQKVLNLSS